MADPTDVLFETPPADPAPAEATPPPAAAEPPAPPVPPAAPGGGQMVIDPDTGQHVPLAKYLDQRDQYRQAQARVQQLEQELSRRNPPKPVEVPDPLVDPQGFLNHVQQLSQQGAMSAQQRAEDNRFTVSEMMAVQAYGQDVVDEAFEAFQEARATDPMLWHRFANTRHPWDTLIKWHEQQKLLNSVGADPDAWALKRYNELVAEGRIQGGALAAPAAAPQPPRAPNGQFTASPPNRPQPPAPGTKFRPQQAAPRVPAPSLGNAPASGQRTQATVVGPSAAFDSTFGA